jgi:hypothetical protein
MQHYCKRLMYQIDTIGKGQILEFENAKSTPPRRKIPFVVLCGEWSDNIYNLQQTTTRF